MKLPFISTRPRDRAVGLDVGTTAIKLVELKPRPHAFEITRFGHRLIPPEAQEDDARISELIRELAEEVGLKGAGVYVAVSGQNVVIRRSALPKMPLNELVEAIKWDIREEVLFPLEGAAVDFHITGETVQAGGPFYELLAVVAEEAVIQREVRIIQEAGLRILGITAFPIALWDYDHKLEAIGPGEVTSFIDMGAERTRVYFASENDLLFFREIPSGGQNVTEALMEPFDLPGGGRVVLEEERAEQIKKEVGFPPEDAPGTTSEGIPLADVHERMLTVLNKQAEEIYRSLEYFKNLFKRDDITRINVSGGACGLKGIHEFFSQMLELKINQFNPLLQSQPPVSGVPEEEAHLLGPSLTAAAGLALGRCDKINLLPESLRPSLKKQLIRLAQAAALPLVLAGLFFYSQALRQDVAARQAVYQKKLAERAQLQQALQRLKSPQQELARLEITRTKLQRTIGDMPVGAEVSFDLARLLQELTRVLPANVSLEKLIYDTRGDSGDEDEEPIEGLEIRGQVFGDKVETLAGLEQLMENLGRSPLFSRVTLLETRELNGQTYTHPGLNFVIVGFPSEGPEKPL